MKIKLFDIVGDILSMNPSEVEENASELRLGSPEAWDSLSHLAIMTELEDALNRELTIEEMEDLNSLDKIMVFLNLE